jgi:hypothetical protein
MKTPEGINLENYHTALPEQDAPESKVERLHRLINWVKEWAAFNAKRETSETE